MYGIEAEGRGATFATGPIQRKALHFWLVGKEGPIIIDDNKQINTVYRQVIIIKMLSLSPTRYSTANPQVLRPVLQYYTFTHRHTHF